MVFLELKDRFPLDPVFHGATLSLKEGTDVPPIKTCIKLRELEQLSADLMRLAVGLAG
jgi:hypothetical protein